MESHIVGMYSTQRFARRGQEVTASVPPEHLHYASWTLAIMIDR